MGAGILWRLWCQTNYWIRVEIRRAGEVAGGLDKGSYNAVALKKQSGSASAPSIVHSTYLATAQRF